MPRYVADRSLSAGVVKVQVECNALVDFRSSEEQRRGYKDCVGGGALTLQGNCILEMRRRPWYHSDF